MSGERDMSSPDGISRRDIVGAIAAGAAATGVATSALAQQKDAAESIADNDRAPGRWGTKEIAGLFLGFKHLDMKTKGAVIRVRHGGSGPPLLMMHGHPVNHVSWYKVAPKLARDYHVVLTDLRGYGDSSLPDPGPDNINYSFRAFAQDNVEIMEQLGYQRFNVVGHDRGGRTAHRLCMDHPERVIKACIMDVLPNYHVWTNPTKSWALNSWHWLFLASAPPLPERMLEAVGAEYFLKQRMATRNGAALSFLDEAVFKEYVRAYTPKTMAGTCYDYRAGATCDFEMDTADKDKKVGMPLLILWGAKGVDRENFLAVWKNYATNVRGEGLPSGHYMQEEVPDRLLQHFTQFFKA